MGDVLKMMDVEKYEVKGSYGDRKVMVEYACEKGNRKLMVLFHGVHGSASFVQGNKYASLADILVPEGFDVCLVETSRKIRERAPESEKMAWIWNSFRGKRYCDDLYDNCQALAFILKKFPHNFTALWGFSLGGLHSIFIKGGLWNKFLCNCGLSDLPLLDTNKIALLITSGSGDSLREGGAESLSLPILSTVPSAAMLHEAAGNIHNCIFLSFYGENDATFSEMSCRRIYSTIPLGDSDKSFRIIKGSDHSFREIDGKPTTEPLQQMVTVISEFIQSHGQPADMPK